MHVLAPSSMNTALELEEVLRATRMETGGITLDLVSRIIHKAFAPEEVELLIEGLEANRP